LFKQHEANKNYTIHARKNPNTPNKYTESQ